MSTDADNTIPRTIERTLLHTYLSDHLAGATAGRARSSKMAQWYARGPLGADLTRVAAEIAAERQHLEELIDRLGLGQPLAKRTLARAGELLGRLKANGRLLTGSPMSPLLELDLLRAGVNGKAGLWQSLIEYADELGLDAQVYHRLAEQAKEQSRTLEELHAQIRREALRPGKARRT